MRKGYRAFLMGTATDLPCRGFSLKFQRRDDVERAAADRASDAAAELTGVDEDTWNRKELTNC